MSLPVVGFSMVGDLGRGSVFVLVMECFNVLVTTAEAR
jgi:hypothetical protein